MAVQHGGWVDKSGHPVVQACRNRKMRTGPSILAGPIHALDKRMAEHVSYLRGAKKCKMPPTTLRVTLPNESTEGGLHPTGKTRSQVGRRENATSGRTSRTYSHKIQPLHWTVCGRRGAFFWGLY